GDLLYGVWLDGKAPNGSGQVVWQWNQTELSPNNSLWREDEPDLSDEEDICLLMWPHQVDVAVRPTQPYFARPCTWISVYTLCEEIFGTGKRQAEAQLPTVGGLPPMMP
ncbi:unnamed protein product, partial [Meganyctiphanes norvegica]